MCVLVDKTVPIRSFDLRLWEERNFLLNNNNYVLTILFVAWVLADVFSLQGKNRLSTPPSLEQALISSVSL